MPARALRYLCILRALPPMTVVPDRSKNIMQGLVRQHVEPGSTVMTDTCWPSRQAADLRRTDGEANR